jgi:hypothetical protein
MPKKAVKNDVWKTDLRGKGSPGLIGNKSPAVWRGISHNARRPAKEKGMTRINNMLTLEDIKEAQVTIDIIKQEAKRLENGDMDKQNFSFFLSLMLRFILGELEALKGQK